MNNKEVFIQHVLDCYPQEACGYILDDVFYPVENIHNNPTETFVFPEEVSFMLCDKEYKVIHSHTMLSFSTDPRIPSMEDMKCQNTTQMPWGIVHCDGENVTDILWFGYKVEDIPELVGRPYIPNVYDCFTLANDYYNIHYGITFGTHPRPINWEEWNPHYITQNYLKQGFSEVQSPKRGDILLFSIGSSYLNHIGVYLGENLFLHHLHKRKSEADSLPKWQKHLYKILRHKDVRKAGL